MKANDPGRSIMSAVSDCCGHKKTGYISRFLYVKKILMHVFMVFIIQINM